MWSGRTGSSSSADLPPGAVVADFRIERVIGSGSRATVYEATQLSLGRRVAFKVMRDRGSADRVRRLSWPDHPGAVSLFASGDSEHGPWLAMRLMSGPTLASRRAPLEPVAAALTQAHAEGIVHGDVTARNVFVDDGRARLSDFGLAVGEATAADDRAALAQLMQSRAPRVSRRRAALVAAAGVAGAAALLTAVLGSGGADEGAGEPPRAPAGTRAIGSDLAPGDVASVDCNGRPPGGASPACTISQRELAGRAVVVPADGTITSWAVRGARGTLSLQVLRGRGSRLLQIDKSAEETVPGREVHLAHADLAVAAGDRVALEVAPGAAVGIRRGVRDAAIERWFGPLLEPARLPERPAGTGLDAELLLRVDISPRAGAADIAPLRGARAADAPVGRTLASRTVAVGGGEVRTVKVVVLGGGVALDLFDGARRLARAPVAGADGRGQLDGVAGSAGAVRVRWRNPDGGRLTRVLAVSARQVR